MFFALDADGGGTLDARNVKDGLSQYGVVAPDDLARQPLCNRGALTYDVDQFKAEEHRLRDKLVSDSA